VDQQNDLEQNQDDDELREIDRAASHINITVHGARYPEQGERLTGR
jgi:hypothetical protein